MCTCIYTCTYTCICTCIYTCTYTCIYTVTVHVFPRIVPAGTISFRPRDDAGYYSRAGKFQCRTSIANRFCVGNNFKLKGSIE